MTRIDLETEVRKLFRRHGAEVAIFRRESLLRATAIYAYPAESHHYWSAETAATNPPIADEQLLVGLVVQLALKQKLHIPTESWDSRDDYYHEQSDDRRAKSS